MVIYSPRKRRLPPLAAGTLACILASASSAAPSEGYDLLILHGQVLDGSGSAPVKADVGVRGTRVAAIGDLSKASARERIDATGMIVAPGFINVHDHSDPKALGTAVNMLTQGVTTAMLNPDGYGPTDLGKQLSEFAQPGTALNIGGYVGFNSVWQEVVGLEDRRPTAKEIERMRALIERNLEAGAWGVSAGLDYKPGYYAKPEEVESVVGAAAPWRTNFPNHDRLSPENGWSSRAGVAETIAIASAAGLSPEITHIKAQGHEQGSAPDILAMMRRATADGHYTPGDVYPYLAGMTDLYAFFVPGWAQAGGHDAMLARFKDPAQRARIVSEAEAAMQARFKGAANVYLPESHRVLADIASQEKISPGEAVLRVLEAGENDTILTFGDENDMRAFLAAPTVAVACDCGATLQDSSASKKGHPRVYGTFPRVLGFYVREQHVLSLPEAVRKMTGLPASIVGLVDRGLLAPGMAADITVFDPGAIADHSTYEAPDRLSTGVRDVVVNGEIELRDASPSGAHGGRVLLRTEHMPTRPMSVIGHGHVTVANAALKGGDDGSISVSLDLSQGAQGKASGKVRILDSKSRPIFQAVRLGALQIARHWASITGWARLRGGDRQTSFTIIADGADPRTPGRATVLIVLDTGRYEGEIAPGLLRITT